MTVILPVYNAGELLPAALERLADAVWEGCQVIVVDDGSSDATRDHVRAFLAGRSGWQMIALDRNGGVAHARNEALRTAAGDYVWFVDWDDEWDPRIVRRMYDLALSSGADVVAVGARWKTADGHTLRRVESLGLGASITGERAFEAVLEGRLKGYLWSKLWRRSALPVPMFPVMTSQSDFCGAVRVLPTLSRVAIDETVMYHHVMREGSITNSKNPRLANLSECRRVVHDVARSLPSSSRATRLLRRYDYDFWYLSRVNTALRLSGADAAAAEVTDVRAAMTWRDIGLVSRESVVVGLKACGVKVLGARYGTVRAHAIAVRSRVRSARRSPVARTGR